eukprot:scaffold607_cov160-Ochromonas_danica.AAC.21
MVIFSSYEMTMQDDIDLLHLHVPVPAKERDRIKILRQTKILDSSSEEPSFDRYTTLCSRIFGVSAAESLLGSLRSQYAFLVGPHFADNIRRCSETMDQVASGLW